MLTESQRRALITLLLIWAAVLGYQIVKQLFFTPDSFDFSRTDSLFRHTSDSLRRTDASGQPPSPAEATGQSATLQAASRQATWENAPLPIDVNTADAATLTRLPRIGPAIAQRIVAYREQHGPFRTPEDLLKVKGIGPKTLERIRPHIAIQHKQTSR